MVGYVEVKDSAPLEAQDEEHIDNAKRCSRYDSEVNRKGLVASRRKKARFRDLVR